MIDNYFPYEKEELFYSWIARLATANALSIIEFIDLFIHHKRYADINPNQKFRYDLTYNLDYFCKQIQDVKPLDIIKHTSILPGILPLSSPYKNSHIMERFYHNDPDKRLDLIKTLRYCPDCRKNDLAVTKHSIRGSYFWLKRQHHMPGVTVCHIHNRPLIEITDFDGVHTAGDKELPFYEKSYDYVKTAAWLLEADLTCNWNDILVLLKKRMTALGCINGIKPDPIIFNKFFSGYSELLGPTMTIKSLGSKGRSLLEEKSIALLSCFIDKKAHYSENSSLLSLTCGNCKKEYLTTPQRLYLGWRCPDCDKNISTESFLKRINSGEYKLISENDDKLNLYHTVCEREITVSKFDFLHYGSRCSCNRRLSFQEAKRQLPPGYKLVSFVSYSEPAIVIKESCGHWFERRLHNLKRKSNCPVCEQMRFSLDGFIKELSEIRGDEFTVIGDKYTDRKTKIKVRHNPCGREFLAVPYRLLRSQGCTCQLGINKEMVESRIPPGFKLISYTRTEEPALFESIDCGHRFPYIFRKFCSMKNPSCPICPPIYATLESFKEEVFQLYGNDYTVIGDTYVDRKTPIEILHNKCGKSDMYLPYHFLEGRGCSCTKYQLSDGPSKELLEFIQNNYETDEPIILEEMIKHSPNAKRSLQHLEHKGLVFRQMPGVYTLNKDKLDNKILFKAIYLQRKNQIIGYTSGDTFAYELGLINTEPTRISIVSNRESQKHGRTISNCGYKIKIHGPRVKITNENWKQLQALDFTNTFHKFVSKERKPEVFHALKKYLAGISIDSFKPLYEYYPKWIENNLLLLTS